MDEFDDIIESWEDDGFERYIDVTLKGTPFEEDDNFKKILCKREDVFLDMAYNEGGDFWERFTLDYLVGLCMDVYKTGIAKGNKSGYDEGYEVGEREGRIAGYFER